MKLGTQLGFGADLGLSYAELCRYAADLGFQSVDYSLMYDHTAPIWQLPDAALKEEMEQVRAEIETAGMIVGQTHAPMDAYWGNAPETKESRLNAQVQAIKATSYLGSPYMVIHPLTIPWRVEQDVYEKAKALDMEYCGFLKPYLEEYHVKAAIENLFSFNPNIGRYCKSVCSTAAALKDYIDTLDSDRFVVCLDVGHAFLSYQDPVEMIYGLGKKYLHVTHIHDNSLTVDAHQMPGAGRIDWYAVGKALNDIGFEGIFNYEANSSYFHLGDTRSELALELMKVYAEFAKAITQVK